MDSLKQFYMIFSKDLNRYLILMKHRRFFAILRLILYTPGIWIIFFYRFGQYLQSKTNKLKIIKPVNILYNFFYFLISLSTGIHIPIEATIGEGLYIGHWGGIVVHPNTVMGENCNLSQEVTIGEGGRGNNRGVPVIGDRVYIGPGAKIFGNITIGNDVAIGANAVVNKSVPDNAVVGGVPAVVLNYNGSKDFVIIKE